MCKRADIGIVFILTVFMICAFALGCRKQNQSSAQSAQDGIVVIGVVGGTDKHAKSEIKAILRAHGIEPVPEGDFVSGVLVSSREQAERAMRVLKEDPKKRYEWGFLDR